MKGLAIKVVHRWYCPECKQTDETFEVRPHSRYHVCPKLGFMSVPFVAVGTKAKIELREREDYIGKEDVFISPDGRPIMSIVTTRENGNDAMVFAPTVHVRVG